MIYQYLASLLLTVFAVVRSSSPSNGGTVAALGGRGFAIIAADTRHSDGYTIRSRTKSRITPVSLRTCLSSAGCSADTSALHRLMKRQAREHEWNYESGLSTQALAQKFSRTLYSQRFSPYHAFSVVAGLDDDGFGACFVYDAVGSFERSGALCAGSAHALLQPILDRLLPKSSAPATESAAHLVVDASLDVALRTIKEGFQAAAERDIFLGDSIEISIIDVNGIRTEVFKLPRR